MMVVTPVLFSSTSDTRISGQRADTPTWRPTGSRDFSRTNRQTSSGGPDERYERPPSGSLWCSLDFFQINCERPNPVLAPLSFPRIRTGLTQEQAASASISLSIFQVSMGFGTAAHFTGRSGFTHVAIIAEKPRP